VTSAEEPRDSARLPLHSARLSPTMTAAGAGTLVVTSGFGR
jgi:hypothetical protein